MTRSTAPSSSTSEAPQTRRDTPGRTRARARLLGRVGCHTCMGHTHSVGVIRNMIWDLRSMPLSYTNGSYAAYMDHTSSTALAASDRRSARWWSCLERDKTIPLMDHIPFSHQHSPAYVFLYGFLVRFLLSWGIRSVSHGLRYALGLLPIHT